MSPGQSSIAGASRSLPSSPAPSSSSRTAPFCAWSMACRPICPSATTSCGHPGGRAAARFIAAPARCHLPDGLRAWGWAIQLYAVRSRESWGIGDLADLRRLAEWSASALGAGAAVLNPLHAVLPIVPQEPSPYFPSSRRYRNPLYLRVEEVPGASEAGLDVARLAAEGRGLDAERRIDRDAVFRLKTTALEALWRRHGLNVPELVQYRAREGPGLDEFATFCALAEHHGAGWRRWPAEHRHPASPGSRALRGRARGAGRVSRLGPVPSGRAARPGRARAPADHGSRHRLRRRGR